MFEKLRMMEKVLIEECKINRKNKEELKNLMDFYATLKIEVKLNKKSCDGNPYIPTKDQLMEETTVEVNDDISNVENIIKEAVHDDIDKEKDEITINEVTTRESGIQTEPSRTESEDTLNSYDQSKDMGADDVKTESKDIKSDITKIEIPPDNVKKYRLIKKKTKAKKTSAK